MSCDLGLSCDVRRYLHNEMMFAVAQRKCVYVYDHSGMELHRLKQMRDVHRLTFLPHHFLLVSSVSLPHYLCHSMLKLQMCGWVWHACMSCDRSFLCCLFYSVFHYGNTKIICCLRRVESLSAMKFLLL